MVPCGKLQRIRHLQAVECVEPEGGQAGFEEADARHDLKRQAGRGGCLAQCRHRRLADRRIARHGIHHAGRPARQFDQPSDDLRVHGLEIVRLLVQLIERLDPHLRRQAGERRMLTGAQVDLALAAEHVDRTPGQQVRIARSEADDSHTWRHSHLLGMTTGQGSPLPRPDDR